MSQLEGRNITFARSHLPMDTFFFLILDLHNLHDCSLFTKQREQKEQSSLSQHDSHAVHFPRLVMARNSDWLLAKK